MYNRAVIYVMRRILIYAIENYYQTHDHPNYIRNNPMYKRFFNTLLFCYFICSIFGNHRVTHSHLENSFIIYR